MNYQTITQLKAYSFGSLLGDIGGQMGLFIGASILTLLEFGEYFSILISTKLSKAFSFLFESKSKSKRKRTRTRSRSQSFEYEQKKKILELEQRLTAIYNERKRQNRIDDDVDDRNSYDDALRFSNL